MNSPALEPIENPKGIYLKLVYWYLKRMFGKVISPAKIIYARSPELMDVPVTLQKVERKLILDPRLILLIKSYIAWKNGCSFCSDLNQAVAIQNKLGKNFLSNLEDFEKSKEFTEKEKAVLLALRDLQKSRKIQDTHFQNLKNHFTEKEIVQIVWVQAMEEYYNALAIPLNIHSDSLASLWNT